MNRIVSWSCASLLVLTLIPACGGDDNGGTGSTAQLIATCEKVCSKEKECLGKDASFLDCKQMCSPDRLQPKPTTGEGSEVMCDYGKLRSKFESCLKLECSALNSCMEEAGSTCAGSAPTGPTTGDKPSPGKTGLPGVPTPPDDSTPPDDGTGTPIPGGGNPPGTTPPGSAGSAGDCSVCGHANDCCVALFDLAGEDVSTCDAFSEAQCKAIPAAQQGMYVELCKQTLDTGLAAGVAECK